MLQRPPKPPTTPARPTPRSSTSSAARNRAYRRRKQLGLIVCKIEVDGWVLSRLAETGFLQEWNDADRAAVAAALRDFLHVWSRYEP